MVDSLRLAPSYASRMLGATLTEQTNRHQVTLSAASADSIRFAGRTKTGATESSQAQNPPSLLQQFFSAIYELIALPFKLIKALFSGIAQGVSQAKTMMDHLKKAKSPEFYTKTLNRIAAENEPFKAALTNLMNEPTLPMARHEQQGAKGFLKHVGHFLHFVDLGVKAGEASPLQLQHPLLMDKLNALVSKDKDEQADAAQFFLKAFVKSGDLSQLYPEFFKSQARKNNPKFLLVTAKETPEQGTTFSGQWIKGFRHFVTQIHSIFKGPKALEAEFRRHASYFGIQSMDVAQTAFLASRELAEIKALQDPSQPAPAPDEEPPVLQQTREALENLESANLSTRLKGILFFTKITGATKRVQESPHQFGNFRERVEDLFKARPKIRQIVMDKIQHDDLPQLIALAAEETAYELSRRDAFGEKHADREQRVSQSALNGLLNPDRKIQARAANYFANMIAQNRTYFINKLYSGNRHFN